MKNLFILVILMLLSTTIFADQLALSVGGTSYHFGNTLTKTKISMPITMV